MLGRLAREPDVGNNHGKLVSITPHREHHAEITEGAINQEPHGPLRSLRLIAQHVRGDQEVREEEPEQKTECRGRKCAKGKSFEETIREDDQQAEDKAAQNARQRALLDLGGNEPADRRAKSHKQDAQEIYRQKRCHCRGAGLRDRICSRVCAARASVFAAVSR